MSILAAFPGLFAVIFALQRGPAIAFLNVYIPVVFLLPSYYRWYAPGLPDPSFHHAAVFPIFFIWIFSGKAKWRFSFMDVVVFSIVFIIGYSEYSASNWADAQNLLIDIVAAMLLPYILAKGLIIPYAMSVEVGKRIVMLLFIICIVSLWEFKMGYTPWAMILDKFFPGQNNWVTTFRWGFTRIAGPYGHAILAGIILVAGFRIQRWLQWRGHWGEGRKAQLITLGLLGGIIMTMVKGAWLGAIVAAGLMSVGRSKKPAVALTILGVLAVVILIPGFIWLKSWAGVGRENAKTTTQETAAYRWELVEEYGGVAMDHAALGWGRGRWPAVPGFPSIDNYYLLLLLDHGIIALLLLWYIFLGSSIRLMIRGARAPPGSEIRLLTFALASIYGLYFAALATVYLGAQTIQFLFIITGWADGILSFKMQEPQDGKTEVKPVDNRLFKFKRVLA
jgi:hypothetical protein